MTDPVAPPDAPTVEPNEVDAPDSPSGGVPIPDADEPGYDAVVTPVLESASEPVVPEPVSVEPVLPVAGQDETAASAVPEVAPVVEPVAEVPVAPVAEVPVAPVVDAPVAAVLAAPAPVVATTVDPVVEPAEPSPTPAATTRPGRGRRGARRRVQGRTIRHIDPWSVARVSVLVYLVLYGVFLVAVVLLWGAAADAGVIADLEELIAELWDYSDDYAFDSSALFRGAVLTGGILVIAGTAFNVLATVLFNLISDIVGGIRVTLVDD